MTMASGNRFPLAIVGSTLNDWNTWISVQSRAGYPVGSRGGHERCSKGSQPVPKAVQEYRVGWQGLVQHRVPNSRPRAAGVSCNPIRLAAIPEGRQHIQYGIPRCRNRYHRVRQVGPAFHFRNCLCRRNLCCMCCSFHSLFARFGADSRSSRPAGLLKIRSTANDSSPKSFSSVVPRQDRYDSPSRQKGFVIVAVIRRMANNRNWVL